MYKSLIIVGIALIGACINPYKKFEEVPDELEDISLKLYLNHFNDTMALDASGHDNHGSISDYHFNQNEQRQY